MLPQLLRSSPVQPFAAKTPGRPRSPGRPDFDLPARRLKIGCRAENVGLGPLRVEYYSVLGRQRMHFDRRLWELTRGLRGRIALTILIGLLASGFGIARFVLLGALLARVFAGAGAAVLIGLAIGVAVAVLLRGFLDHARTVIAHGTATRMQER